MYFKCLLGIKNICKNSKTDHCAVLCNFLYCLHISKTIYRTQTKLINVH